MSPLSEGFSNALDVLRVNIRDLEELEVLSAEEAHEIITRWIEGDGIVDDILLEQVIPPAQILIHLVGIAGMKPQMGYVQPTLDECNTFLTFFCYDKKRSLEIAMHVANSMKADMEEMD